jgi:hypothetical protein
MYYTETSVPIKKGASCVAAQPEVPQILVSVDDRGWNLSFSILFASLGLSSAPAPGTVRRMAVVLHDRDDTVGTPIPDQAWPEALSTESPATWGYLALACRPIHSLPQAPAGALRSATS